MLIRLIVKLRQKPKAVKDNIAFAVAGVFTFIVFSFWAYNLPNSYNPEGVVSNESESGMFSTFFEGLSEQLASVKESVSSLEEDTAASSTRISAEEYLNSRVKESIEEEKASSTNQIKEPPKEVRIVTIKSTTSSSTLSGE